ncbi:MAG: CHAT domain-containing protein [Polyangiaceae bacterium]
MKTPPPPDGESPPAPPRDPIVEELAQQIKTSSLPEARALVPMSASERRAMVTALLGPEEDEGPGPADNVVPLSGRRRAGGRRWWPYLVAAALGALGAAALVLRSGAGRDEVAYELRVEGDMVVRGDTPPPPDAPVVLRPSTRLLVVLTPAGRAPDASLRMLVVRDGKARLLHPPFENDGQGKITIDKAARDALGDQENGSAELVWIVGRPMPEDEELSRIALGPREFATPGLTVLRRRALFKDWGGASLSSPGDVLFTGCEGMIRGPVCEMKAGGELVLWAPFGPSEGRVDVDGRATPSSALPIDGGARWNVVVPAGARDVALSSPRLSAPLHVAVTSAPLAPELAEAIRLVDDNDLDRAEKALDGVTDTSPRGRVTTLRQRARVARRRGDPARAEALFREAATLAAQEGRLSDEIESRHVLALQAMTQRRDHGAAEAELARTLPLEAEARPWRAAGAYYRGVLAQERGRYAEALTAFTAVRRDASRLNVASLEAVVLQPLAEMLSVWGRDDDAAALLQRAYSLTPDKPCERGRVLTNWAWAEHRAAGTPSEYERAAARSEEALRVLGGSPCGTVLTTARMNAALSQAAAGKTREARASLEMLQKTAAEDARIRPWAARLAMDLDRAESPLRALNTAERLERDLAESPLPEVAFEAALGKAMALDSLGREDDAERAYEEAARRESAWAAAAPLGEGRSLFFERQRSASRAWVDFALRRAEAAPKTPEAERTAAFNVASVVRKSLGRFLATLLPQARAASEAAEERAEAPLPGEVRLHYHPVIDGWVAVGLGGDGSAVVKRLKSIPRSPPGAAADALLSPFEGMLRGARTVVVLADRALREVEIGELPLGGGTLSDRAAVGYALGGPVAPRPGRDVEGCAGKPTALLVVDPSRNLAGARRSGERIASALGSSATVLVGEGASRRAVLSALGEPCLRLFQYDGHAVLGERKDGVEAALVLSDARLTTSEILDASVVVRVPERVLLSGCETAREEGLGVAQAFLQRGSREVLATTSKVDDERAAELMEAVHRKGASGDIDLVTTLRDAVRDLRGPDAGAGPWVSFRVLLP